MQNYSQEIREYAEFIWTSQFGMSVTSSQSSAPQDRSDLVLGIVNITGKEPASVVVKIEPKLIESLTEIMFALDKGKATQDEMRDAISEITNQIGGNLKSLMPQPSSLSIPVVILDDKKPQFPHAKPVTDVAFECQAGKFWVSILEPQENTTVPV